MRVSFLGHQTWLVEHAGAAVMVDPVLHSVFGAGEHSFCAIHPFREVEITRLPPLSGIVLSHEHADHFCLESLGALPRNVPLYVGPMMPAHVIRACEALGFVVTRLPPGQTAVFGHLSMTLFRASPSTPYWENRVYQVLFEQPGGRGSFFIAVDAALSTDFLDEVVSRKRFSPQLVAVSNNAQIPPAGRRSAFAHADLPQDRDPSRQGLVGLALHHSLIVSYMACLPQCNHFLICGGGFIKGHEDLTPTPLSHASLLAAALQSALLTGSIDALEPGQTVELDGDDVRRAAPREDVHVRTLEWIAGRHPRIAAALPKRECPFFPYVPQSQAHAMCPREVDEALQCLAVSLLAAPLGRRIYQDSVAGGGKPVVAIEFIACDVSFHFCIDLVFGEVRRVEAPAATPWSLRFFLADFLALLRGDVEIWDLSGNSIEARFLGKDIEGLVPFLYACFGEHYWPELAETVTRRKLEALEGARAPDTPRARELGS